MLSNDLVIKISEKLKKKNEKQSHQKTSYTLMVQEINNQVQGEESEGHLKINTHEGHNTGDKLSNNHTNILKMTARKMAVRPSLISVTAQDSPGQGLGLGVHPILLRCCKLKLHAKHDTCK